MKTEPSLGVWAGYRNPAATTAISQQFRTITRSDGVINVDTSATTHSARDAFHMAIDLNSLPHQQRRVESFKREWL